MQTVHVKLDQFIDNKGFATIVTHNRSLAVHIKKDIIQHFKNEKKKARVYTIMAYLVKFKEEK